MFQKPWEKPEVALVLIGQKGVGKTFLMDIINILVDGPRRHQHCFKTSNSNDIYGDHREHLKSVIALLLEEVSWGGDKRHESELKNLITGHTQTINIKFGPMITVDNVMRVIMAANPGWVIPATSSDERRYTVAHVSAAHQQDHAYFKEIQLELNCGGYAALMYELMETDIRDFNHREAYITDALIDQTEESMSSVEKWWLSVLRSGQINHVESETYGWILVTRRILYDRYCRDMKKIGTRAKLLQDDQFSLALRSFIPKIENDKIVLNRKNKPESIIGSKRLGTDKEGRYWAHLLPSLAVCRQLMDFRLRRKQDWDEPNTWELLDYDQS